MHLRLGWFLLLCASGASRAFASEHGKAGIRDAWAEEAAGLPVWFAQVREDPRVEAVIVQRLAAARASAHTAAVTENGAGKENTDGGTGLSVLMIGSGGDTVAYLAGVGGAMGLTRMTVVDTNPAQVELARFKLGLLQCPHAVRAALLGHRPMDADARAVILRASNVSWLAPTGRLDLDGRYERFFVEVQRHLQRAAPSPTAAAVGAALGGAFGVAMGLGANVLSPWPTAFGAGLGGAAGSAFAAAVHARLFGADCRAGLEEAQLRAAFDAVATTANLAALFGTNATANAQRPFAEHFAERVWHARYSPWIAHMLCPETNDTYPWHELDPPTDRSTHRTPAVEFVVGPVEDVLRERRAAYDLVQLSNVLDWMTAERAAATLRAAVDAVRHGGIVLVRQLNSDFDLPRLFAQHSPTRVAWRHDDELDQAAIYRTVHQITRIDPNPYTAASNSARPPEAPPGCVASEGLAKGALDEAGTLAAPYVGDLESGRLSRAAFARSQCAFAAAVEYFALPLAALVARAPVADRWTLVENVAEELGEGRSERAHANTFAAFLRSINASCDERSATDPGVRAFNLVLMGAAQDGDVDEALGCFAAIEYAFAHLSSRIGSAVRRLGWTGAQHVLHYGSHATLDVEHARAFFRILDRRIHQPERLHHIRRGLRLGAFAFRQLYDRLSFIASPATSNSASSAQID